MSDTKSDDSLPPPPVLQRLVTPAFLSAALDPITKAPVPQWHNTAPAPSLAAASAMAVPIAEEVIRAADAELKAAPAPIPESKPREKPRDSVLLRFHHPNFNSVIERFTILDASNQLNLAQLKTMFGMESRGTVQKTDSFGHPITIEWGRGNGVTGVSWALDAVSDSTRQQLVKEANQHNAKIQAHSARSRVPAFGARAAPLPAEPAAGDVKGDVKAQPAAAPAAAAASVTAAAPAVVAGKDWLPVPAYNVVNFTGPVMTVHGGVKCGMCAAIPIKGVRYKCNPIFGCNWFDCCLSCYLAIQNGALIAQGHDNDTHSFIAMKRPERMIRELVGGTLSDTMINIFEHYSPMACVGSRQRYSDGTFGDYRWITYAQFLARFLEFGSGLRSVILPRTYVGLLSKNRVEWLIGDFACLLHSFISIPIHTTYTLEAMRYIVGTTGLKLLVCSWEQALLHLLNILDGPTPTTDAKTPDAAPKNVTQIQYVVLMDDDVLPPPPPAAANPAEPAAAEEGEATAADGETAAGDEKVAVPEPAKIVAPAVDHNSETARAAAEAAAAKDAADRRTLLAALKKRGIVVFTFSEMEERGRVQRYPPVFTAPNDLNTVIFTSGSTGLPKGVMITERIQFGEYADTIKSYGDYMAAHPVMLEFFPFAWATGRDDFRMNALMGGAFAIYERPMQYLLEELRVVRPSAIQGVPSIYAVIYAEAVRLLRLRQEKMKNASKMRANYEAKFTALMDALETPDAPADGADAAPAATAAAGDEKAADSGAAKPVLGRQKSEVKRPLTPTIPGDDEAPAAAATEPASATEGADTIDSSPEARAAAAVSADGKDGAATVLDPAALAAAAAAGADDKTPDEPVKPTTSSAAVVSANPYLNSLFPKKKSPALGELNKSTRANARMQETLKRKVNAHTEAEYEIMRGFADQLIGDRARYIMTGGAMTSPTVLEFLKNVFPHCRVYDGYGTTEAGGISLDYKLEKKSGVQMKLVDVPEMGYFSTDKPYPRGEICVKTKRMAAGYFNNPEATARQFIDGWFHTGDIGVKTPMEDEIWIIDRKSAFFKLSNGEFISPEHLEGVFGSSRYVFQMFVHGESDQAFLLAVVIVHLPLLLGWATTQPELKRFVDALTVPTPGAAAAPAAADAKAASPDAKDDSVIAATVVENPNPALQAEFLKHPAVLSMLSADFHRIALLNNTPPTQVPRALHLTLTRFSAENGQLTPSLKICRHQIRKTYQSDLRKLYTHNDPIEQRVNAIVAAIAKAIGLTEFVSRSPVAGADEKGKVSNDEPVIDPRKSLAAMGITSIETIRLVSAVRDQLQVELPLDLAFRSDFTLNDLAAHLRKQPKAAVLPVADSKDQKSASLGDSKSALAALPVSKGSDREQTLTSFRVDVKQDWTAALKAGPGLKVPPPAAVTAIAADRKSAPEQHIFVTGATGFLGVYLLHTLLTTRSAATKYHVLVRAKDDKQALRRLSDAMRSKSIWEDRFVDQLNVRACSLDHTRFGLADADWAALTAIRFEAIYHCAAFVNWVLPYSALRTSNVVGTLEVMRLAIESGCPVVHHVSTLSVAGSSPDENFWDDSGSDIVRSGHADGYTLSKWVSELIARQLCAKFGIALAIFRPGTVTGHSVTGHSNPTDFLPRYLKSVLELKAYVDEPGGSFELTPVDVMSALIVDLSRATEHKIAIAQSTKPAAAQNTAAKPTLIVFHVANHFSNLISYRVMGQYAARALPSTPLVAMRHSEWLSHFLQHKSNSLYALLSFVQEPTFWTTASIDTSVTNTLAVWNEWRQLSTAAAAGGKPAVAATPAAAATIVDPFPRVSEQLIGAYMRRLISPVALIRQGSIE